jgi:hypothetical protein
MWKNLVERQATDKNTTRRTRIACWINEATDTYSEYVILIAFPRQQLLRERASILRYTFIARRVKYSHGSWIVRNYKNHEI